MFRLYGLFQSDELQITVTICCVNADEQRFADGKKHLAVCVVRVLSFIFYFLQDRTSVLLLPLLSISL